MNEVICMLTASISRQLRCNSYPWIPCGRKHPGARRRCSNDRVGIPSSDRYMRLLPSDWGGLLSGLLTRSRRHRLICLSDVPRLGNPADSSYRGRLRRRVVVAARCVILRYRLCRPFQEPLMRL